MKNVSRFLILVASFSMCGCASRHKHEYTEVEKYALQVSPKVKPVWEAEVTARAKSDKQNNSKSPVLKYPENSVLLLISISRSGEIKEIQFLKKSEFAFINDTGKAAFEKLGQLPPPPESCIKQEVCKIEWKFIVEQ